jgi:hypothetical protein
VKQIVLGLDIDGVLADFNRDYRRKLIEVSGRSLIPEGEVPPCWQYAPAYGYTKEEDSRAWASIKADTTFWANLSEYRGAAKFLWALDVEATIADYAGKPEIYFITTRPGLDVKVQTEEWLGGHGVDTPTVLISRGDKGLLAKGLGLTHFIDDRPENCYSVKEHSPDTAVFLLSWRYNEAAHEECRKRGISIFRDHDEMFRYVLDIFNRQDAERAAA